jgi:hypothetical protein
LSRRRLPWAAPGSAITLPAERRAPARRFGTGMTFMPGEPMK